MTSEKIIDSFEFLYRQVERDIIHLFSDVRDGFALVGVCYSIKKVCVVTANLVQAINVHFVCQYITSIDRGKWIKKYGPWAVVTGGSDGIGQEYACQLAKRGLNIVLISRNENKLLKAKSYIEEQSGAQVDLIVADFASDNQAELYVNIKEKLSNKEIGLLVNNVGVMYDHPDVLLNITTEKLWQLMTINIGAATRMTHMLLPQMVERGRGGVVVMSSSAAFQVTPKMTVYAASKRYLDYFLQGVAYEYRKSGVTFQTLVPFYISTNMTSYSSRLTSCRWLVPAAADYVQSAVPTLGYSARTTGYFPHTLQLWFSQLVPNWLWMWASSKLNDSLRREAIGVTETNKATRPPEPDPITFDHGVSGISAQTVLSSLTPTEEKGAKHNL